MNYLNFGREAVIYRLGELFCGPGGIGYAAITAKIANPDYKIIHAWANDYDKDTCDTFSNNIAKDEKTVICKDIRKLDYAALHKISEIDALAFGFPCNDFSVVGEQKGMDGVYGPLYSYGIRALKEFKPVWFLAENVGGLRNANDGKAFSKILSDMFDAGYSVYPHLYKFEEYGVPQARHRIIIIGIRKDQNIVYKVPSTDLYKNKLRTCRDAIENPPIPKDAKNNELTKQSDDVIKRLQHIKPGQNAFTADIPEELQLNVTGAKISQIYRRLDPNKPAYTITGSGGGGTHVYHWKEDRALTNRERARLQTFPDDFVFSGSKESVRKQIGMAVPCDGVRIIFEALLNCFAGVEYRSAHNNLQPLIHEEQREIYNSQYPEAMYLLENDTEYITA
jgi:DNA (cytosine-5)-methyltransferase 1